MKSILLIGFVAMLLTQVSNAADSSSDARQSWGQWRGPLATGFASDANPPTEWSDTKNVRWKIKTPGFGTSTPIVWGERIFILTAIPTGKKVTAKKAEGAAEEEKAMVLMEERRHRESRRESESVRRRGGSSRSCYVPARWRCPGARASAREPMP